MEHGSENNRDPHSMSDEGTWGGNYEKLIGRDVKSRDGYGSGPILARSGQWGEWQTPCAPPGRRMGMVQGVEMRPSHVG